MTGAGTSQRERFMEAMQKIAVGSIVRRSLEWLIVKQERFDTSASLTLRRGRRQINVSVPICITGPALCDVGLAHVSCAPTQRQLISTEEA